MPKLGVKGFIEAIRMEQQGFKIGKPWRYAEDNITCVVPILRHLDEEPIPLDEDPRYLVLAKASKCTLEDTGNISKVLVKNEEKVPVFIRMGELLKGGTQERSAVMSRVIMPGMKDEIEVVCIHATKGIRAGAEFTGGDYVPGKDAMFARSMYFMNAIDQHQSWNEDRGYKDYAMASAPSISSSTVSSTGSGGGFTEEEVLASLSRGQGDDITSTFSKTKDLLSEVIKAVPLFDNQIGISLIDEAGFHSLECYDIHASWKDVKEAIVGKECLSISQKDEEGVFEYKPEKAQSTIKDTLANGYDDRVQLSEPRTSTITLGYNGYIGEAVMLDNEVIHLLIARDTESQK